MAEFLKFTSPPPLLYVRVMLTQFFYCDFFQAQSNQGLKMDKMYKNASIWYPFREHFKKISTQFLNVMSMWKTQNYSALKMLHYTLYILYNLYIFSMKFGYILKKAFGG